MSTATKQTQEDTVSYESLDALAYIAMTALSPMESANKAAYYGSAEALEVLLADRYSPYTKTHGTPVEDMLEVQIDPEFEKIWNFILQICGGFEFGLGAAATIASHPLNHDAMREQISNVVDQAIRDRERTFDALLRRSSLRESVISKPSNPSSPLKPARWSVEMTATTTFKRTRANATPPCALSKMLLDHLRQIGGFDEYVESVDHAVEKLLSSEAKAFCSLMYCDDIYPSTMVSIGAEFVARAFDLLIVNPPRTARRTIMAPLEELRSDIHERVVSAVATN